MAALKNQTLDKALFTCTKFKMKTLSIKKSHQICDYMKLFLIKSFIYSHPWSLKYLIYEAFFCKYIYGGKGEAIQEDRRGKMGAEGRKHGSRGEATCKQRRGDMGAEERQHRSRGEATWEKRRGSMQAEEKQYRSRGEATQEQRRGNRLTLASQKPHATAEISALPRHDLSPR